MYLLLLPTYLFTNLRTCLPTHLSTHLPAYVVFQRRQIITLHLPDIVPWKVRASNHQPPQQSCSKCRQQSCSKCSSPSISDGRRESRRASQEVEIQEGVTGRNFWYFSIPFHHCFNFVRPWLNYLHLMLVPYIPSVIVAIYKHFCVYSV